MKCHGQVREKQVDTWKVNQTVPTEPKGSREFNDSLGNITTSNQELFQCTDYFNSMQSLFQSLSELGSVIRQVIALHYEEPEFINCLIKPGFVLSQLSSATTQGVLPCPGAQQSVFERKKINKLIH